MNELNDEKEPNTKKTQKEPLNQDTDSPQSQSEETQAEDKISEASSAAETSEPSKKKEKRKKEKIEIDDYDDDEDDDEDKEDTTQKWHIITAIAFLIIIVLLVLLLVRQCSLDVPTLNPDYPPQETDKNLEPIPDDDTDKLEFEEGGGAVALNLSDKLSIDLSDKRATLKFANPGSSSSNMVLWILIQDTVVAQSGLILPGYQIDNLDLVKDIDKSLSEGIYEGKFVVHFYDPETNERAVVNSEFPVTITVTQ